jgi:hypothetical protein
LQQHASVAENSMIVVSPALMSASMLYGDGDSATKGIVLVSKI